MIGPGKAMLGAMAWAVAAAYGRAGDNWPAMRDIRPRGYVCQHAAAPIRIDGRLDDLAWQKAPWTEDFQDIEGERQPRPAYRTRAKMLWDNNYFYVAAELQEPHVWATLTERDSVIFRDPDFEVFIDPDGDRHEYYEFEMNALNTVWDLFLRKPYQNGGPAINNWDIAGLKSAVRVDGTLNNSTDRDEGWSVEIAFPWEALRAYAHRPVPPRSGDQWRVNFSRVEWDIEIAGGGYRKVAGHPEHNWVWSPQGVIDMHRPEKWGYVQFTKSENGPAVFQRDPGEPIRDALMEIYYAERSFFAAHQRWARSTAELGLEGDIASTLGRFGCEIQLTGSGFLATAKLARSGRPPETWQVGEDGHLLSATTRR